MCSAFQNVTQIFFFQRLSEKCIYSFTAVIKNSMYLSEKVIIVCQNVKKMQMYSV